MRRTPRIFRGGSKRVTRTTPKPPPKCREVTVEVMGVGPGLKRIDVVSDAAAPQVPPPEPQPVPEGDRWESIEDALAATNSTSRPDPWDRLTR